MIPEGLFEWPTAFLVGAVVVPILWIGFGAFEAWRLRRLIGRVGPRGLEHVPDLSPSSRRLQRRLMLASSALAFTALAQPRWGSAAKDVESRGVDLLLCLDVSRSMLARDLRPNRLERALEEVRALLDRARGDRIGLIVFAGTSELLIPLTHDLRFFRELLDRLDEAAPLRGGTDLGTALDRGLAALASASGDHEAIILLTDGEDLEERGLRAAARCRARNVTVHAVGLGSSEGSKIPVARGNDEEFLKDGSGREVISALDRQSLVRITDAAGGQFVEALRHPRPLLEVYERAILPMARKTILSRERPGSTPRFQWPLLAAWILWAWKMTLTGRRKP